MEIAYFAISSFLVLATVVPLLPNQHWSVRWFDFIKLQAMLLALLTFALAFRFESWTPAIWWAQGLTLASILYNGVILIQYTPIYPVKTAEIWEQHSDSVKLLSANVLQFNTDYPRFIEEVHRVQPDIVLTMESNEDWDTGMKPLEEEYPYMRKVPLENTYGMHLYSKLPMTSEVHYFIADDLPSIEAEVETRQGYKFTLFCLHPPPPSPTEEDTSKERDGELMAVAKKIRQDKKTTVVVGDFNNVAWARSSVLFRKVSETIDPRIGRGFASTFHAKYWFFRFPIDQLFHTPDVFIQELKTTQYCGSDHLPLFCQFYLNKHDDSQDELVEELEQGEMSEVNELIEEGIAEEGNRDEVATE